MLRLSALTYPPAGCRVVPQQTTSVVPSCKHILELVGGAGTGGNKLVVGGSKAKLAITTIPCKQRKPGAAFDGMNDNNICWRNDI